MKKTNQTDLVQKAKNLEKLRNEIEDIAYEIGRIGDMVDRFQPSDAESPNLGKKVQNFHTEKKLKNKELKGLVELYTKENPKIIEVWLSWHEEVCTKLLKETEKDHERFTIRHNLAEDILGFIDEVKKGDRYKFSINNFFLDDYYEKIMMT
ncbi:MAG: hypothetical protein GY714_17990 [Desulfobacterales bacterium]|nr:hypothetical protein [Desulfobacterales bacterium]